MISRIVPDFRDISLRLFYIITIDFILILSKIDVGFDYYILITKKFNKVIIFIARNNS